jgi:nitroreductase
MPRAYFGFRGVNREEIMELFEAITGRRSVRDYLDSPVSEDDVKKILEAARWAPSWANTQCARYIVVRDPALKTRLKETLSPNNPARDSFDVCPAVIAVLGKLQTAGYKKGQAVDDKQWHMYDCALATQNICLSAHAVGLATVIVGFFDYAGAGEVLGVPAEYQVVCLLPLGYPKRTPDAPRRKEISELASNDRFSQ